MAQKKDATQAVIQAIAGDVGDEAWKIGQQSEALPVLYRASLSDAAERLQLTSDEARAILDACNGLMLVPELAGQHVFAEVYDSFHQGGLAQQWDVDETLIDRLRVLSMAERWAVELWASAFWIGGDPERYPGGRYNDEAFEVEHLGLVVRREEKASQGRAGRPRLMPGEETVRFDLKWPRPLKERLDELAAEARLSVSEFIRRRVF